jgi:hypothetical protein
MIKKKQVKQDFVVASNFFPDNLSGDKQNIAVFPLDYL